MSKWVILRIVKAPTIDPKPGETIELKVYDLACDQCEIEEGQFLKLKGFLRPCVSHWKLDILSFRQHKSSNEECKD